IVVEVRILGEIAGATLRPAIAHGGAEDSRGAAGGKDEPHQDLDRRGLARTVGSQKPEDLAGLHRERHAAQRFGTAPKEPAHERLAQILDLEDGHQGNRAWTPRLTSKENSNQRRKPSRASGLRTIPTLRWGSICKTGPSRTPMSSSLMSCSPATMGPSGTGHGPPTVSVGPVQRLRPR